MTLGMNRPPATQQLGKSTSPSERLLYGRRSKTGVRLAMLAGLFALSAVVISAGMPPAMGGVIATALALLVIFGGETHWTCANGTLIIETSSLVTTRTIVIAGRDVGSLEIKASTWTDGPDTHDLELRTRSGSLHKFNHSKWDDANAMLTQLRAALGQ